jgi:hypothetical protein
VNSVSQKNSTVEPSVAYILKGFPRLSETFIANEIRLLEEMGTRLRLFSIKQGDAGRMHSMVGAIESPLEYLPKLTSLSGTTLLRWLRLNGAVFRRSHVRLLLRRPVRYLSTLIEAVRMSFRYRNEQTGAPRKVFIKEFLQAGDIADRIAGDASIRHLHGHFCHGATTVTWFVSRLTGLPFSFRVGSLRHHLHPSEHGSSARSFPGLSQGAHDLSRAGRRIFLARRARAGA